MINTILQAKMDFVVLQGDTLSFYVDFFEDETETIPFPLTVWDDLIMQVKLAKVDDVIALQLSLGDGLEIDPIISNRLRFYVDSSLMMLEKGIYVYDIQGYSAAQDRTILTGSMTFTLDVTRI